MTNKCSYTSVIFVQYWNITGFQWKPEEYGGITYLTFNAEDIWTPDLAVINS